MRILLLAFILYGILMRSLPLILSLKMTYLESCISLLTSKSNFLVSSSSKPRFRSKEILLRIYVVWIVCKLRF